MTPCKEKKKAAETAAGTPGPSAAAVAAKGDAPLEVSKTAPVKTKPAAGVTTDVPAVKDPEAEKHASLMQLALKRKQLLEVPFGLYCMAKFPRCRI